MRGEAHIFRPGQANAEVVVFNAPPTLEFLRTAVRGDIEPVPFFISFAGAPCVAFCNEHGRLEGLAYNAVATALWRIACEKARAEEWFAGEQLLGPVVVLTGDHEFRAAL